MSRDKIIAALDAYATAIRASEKAAAKVDRSGKARDAFNYRTAENHEIETRNSTIATLLALADGK